jgi:prophage antirepressor-like protein|nr:MAG: hypothetical protein [Bacteriophage sp.]
MKMNENEIRVWNYESSEVRTVQVNGEPWFVLSDVCKVLELSTPARVAERLEKDEVSQTHTIDRMGREQKTTIINESGLYTVILRSDKPQAKPFRKWVTSEVLPSIRKHGSYSVQSQFADLSPQLQVLIQMETRQKQIEARQAEQATALAGLEQKIQNTCEVIALDKTAWRKDSEHLINKIARATGEGYGGIRLVYEEIYRSIESRAGVSLNTRLTNKRNRMAGEGVCKSKRDKLTRIDIIAEDKKLIEIYVAIVKELAVKYGVCA